MVIPTSREQPLRLERTSIETLTQRADGPTYLVRQTSTDVQIDGDLREWQDVVPILLNDEPHAQEWNPELGWGGPEDLSVTAYLMWDQSNLYVACDVVDDALYSPVGPSASWLGDCLELAFDPLHDGKERGFDEDDSHFCIALMLEDPYSPKGCPIIYCDASARKPLRSVRIDGDGIVTNDLEAVVVKKVGDGRYIYEVRLPWEALGVAGPPTGREWGFTFGVMDNDGQGGWEGGVRWTRGLWMPRDVSAFGHLIFVEEAPSQLQITQTINKQTCGGEETLCVDLILNSPEVRDDLQFCACVISERGHVLEEITDTLIIDRGINLYEIVWERESLPMGRYTLQTEIRDGEGGILDRRGFEVFKQSSGIFTGVVEAITQIGKELQQDTPQDVSLLQIGERVEEAGNRLRQGTIVLNKVLFEVLAMQGSQDFIKVAWAVWLGLKHLEVECRGCAIRIWDEGIETIRVYGVGYFGEITVGRSGDPNLPFYSTPLLYYKELIRHWQEKRRCVWQEDRDNVIDVPFSHGMLEMFRSKRNQFFEWEIRILQGFADVVSLGYTRFLDLQRLEEQARRRQREAAVERVRAAIATMQTSADLTQITALLWRELTALGVPFSRCGVFIVHDEAKRISAYLTTPEGIPLGVLDLPVTSHPTLRRAVAHWCVKEIYVETWDRQAFGEWVQFLLQQGQPIDRERYLAGADLPDVLVLHGVPFVQGTLYVGSPARLSAEDLELVQELADVFSVAYARFLDFQRVEVQNRALVEANKRLQELDRLKSDFVATVSHEFKSPLTVICQLAELLRNDRVASAERRQQYYGAILAEGDRLTRLVDTVLDMARIEAGEKRYVVKETDLRPLLSEVVAHYRLTVEQHGGRLEAELAEELPLVQVDGEAVRQALSNLLDNAVKYGGERGEVTVRAWVENHTVCIAVRDRGIGIPPEDLPKIFDRFYRGGSVLTRRVPGTGLGLALVKHVVEAHRGQILVESEPGKGSAFTMRIPVGRKSVKRKR